MLREFNLRQAALDAPAAQLLSQFAQHLPEQNGRLEVATQPLQEPLRLEPLGRLIAVDGLQQDVGVNGVHAVDRVSDDCRRN